MSELLKIGLVGAGVFAGYHANKLAAHPRVSFIGVHDPDAERAATLAQKHIVKPLTLEGLLAASDALVIACPASSHGPIAIQALQAGCHCLIEKPLAVSSKDADAIVALVEKTSLTVQVGHQERLVIRAIGLESFPERPLKIEAVRNSTYSLRGTDTSVTLDLMTHDIDLCTALVKQVPENISGEAQCVRSSAPDMSRAHIAYHGASAHLEASRVAEVPERHMKITYPSGVVEIDFTAKTLTNSTPFELNTNFGETDIAKDSLGAATDMFVRAVLDKTDVLVTAFDGAVAAKTALQIDGER